MSGNIRARAVLAAPLVVSGLLVSGCMSSPTYGTDKTQSAQLTSDLTGMFSLKPKPIGGEYKPRPELVKPVAPTTELPPPQENIVTASTDVVARIAGAAARAHSRRRHREPGQARFRAGSHQRYQCGERRRARQARRFRRSCRLGHRRWRQDSKKQREEFKRKLAESQQGSPTVRRTLTEPPLEYRAPAATAADRRAWRGRVQEGAAPQERGERRLAAGAIWFPGFDRKTVLTPVAKETLQQF